MATQDHAPYEAVAPADPGWYTLPIVERKFPYGLGGLGLGPADLARWLAHPMTVFAGDRDIETADENLPKSPEALAQGPTRFARAQFFLDMGRREAARPRGLRHDGCAGRLTDRGRFPRK